MYPGAAHEVPMVGRSAELDEIRAAFAADPCAAVVVAGPPGVGKSRLAAEASGEIRATGRVTAHVIATESSAAIPFAPFASLLPDVATVSGGQLQLMTSLAQAIAGLDDGRPILLVVDDAQLLDAGSAALVHQLVQTASCGLIATERTPATSPDPIVSLWKERLARRVEVRALSREDTDALVGSVLGGPVGGSALRWLWDVSAGNPLFVRELLAGAVESGSVYARDGIRFLRLPLPVPPRLADLITSRLTSVAPKTAEVVELLAIGEPLGYAELAGITGQEAIEDAEGRGFITVREDQGRSEVRLSHPLYGELLRPQIPRSRLRRLSATLGAALEQTGAQRRDDVMRIARWRLDAGVSGDPDLFERAARRARAVRDLPLAARLARAALNAGGGVTAGLFLGETEFASGRPKEAEKVLAGLVPICRTDDERAMIASARAYNLGMLLGDKGAAASVIRDALAEITAPSARRLLLIRQAGNDLWSDDLSAALSSVDELVSCGDPLIERRASYIGAVARALVGRTEEAVALAYRAMALHQRSLEDAPDGTGPADYQPPQGQLVGAVIGHLLGGRLAEAEADARRGYEAGLDAGDKEFQATFGLLWGWVLLERGAVAEAGRLLRESAAINRELADPGPLRWCVAGIVVAEAMSGGGAAQEAATELAALEAHWMIALDPYLVDRAQAWALIASGQLSAAGVRLRDAAAGAAATGHGPAEAVLLHELVRLGEAGAAAPRLAELAASVDGDLVSAFAAHAAALAADDPEGLQEVSRRFEEMGAGLLAAEAAHEAERSYASRGKERQATAMARESARLRASCGAERSPLLATLDGGTASLTRREREVALLVLSGLSNKTIADRLYVSVRTVDNHLHHIYTKLGVTNRAELEQVMRPSDQAK